MKKCMSGCVNESFSYCKNQNSEGESITTGTCENVLYTYAREMNKSHFLPLYKDKSFIRLTVKQHSTSTPSVSISLKYHAHFQKMNRHYMPHHTCSINVSLTDATVYNVK